MFKLPVNLQHLDSERNVGVFSFMHNLMHQQTVKLPFLQITFPFWKIYKCVHEYTKKPTEISHFICLRCVYQILPPCCRSISRQAHGEIFLSHYASLEIADISSTVFAVNVTQCNKHGKVNTFQAQKEITVKSYCFFFSSSL